MAVDAAQAGNITLAGTGGSVSFAVAQNAQDLYESFVAGNGNFMPSSKVNIGPFNNVLAGHAAAVVRLSVPSGGVKQALSIVFSWYFPERDHMGVNVGNYYVNLGKSSEDFALPLANDAALTNVVQTINKHHSVFSGIDTSYPLWLQDHMINQMSHFRGMMYLRDGRMREYEAPDCPDVDSIHNDYQRHLPYIWLFPAFEKSKLFKWGEGQAKDGHLWEDLGSFGLGPLDKWADRIMADTTSLWVVEQWEFWRNTGDKQYLQTNYPIITKAIQWMVNNANTNGQGLPYHLTCTYDIIDFEQYDTTTFNSMIYLATMRAGEEMAKVIGDTTGAAFANKAFKFGQQQVYKLLWNNTHQYFRAYTGGNAIMGDCLYGQMVAHHNGLGWLVDQDKLQQHLNNELKYNGDPFGIKVVTGRHEPPPLDLTSSLSSLKPSSSRLRQGRAALLETNRRLGFDTQDDVIWMGGAPDWSYLQIALNSSNTNLDSALKITKNELTNFRDRLRDLWNIVGIISPNDWGTDPDKHGMPYVTSHYGFVMTDYYLLTVLSGQQTDIPNGLLTFTPAYPCPFYLPVLLAEFTGTLECVGGRYTVSSVFGTLSLPKGGLKVNGAAYPEAVNLISGSSVSW